MPKKQINLTKIYEFYIIIYSLKFNKLESLFPNYDEVSNKFKSMKINIYKKLKNISRQHRKRYFSPIVNQKKYFISSGDSGGNIYFFSAVI